MKNRIVISMGDPAGIGPEIILKAVSKKAIRQTVQWIVIGNTPVLEWTAKKCGLNIPSSIEIVNIKNVDIKKYRPGAQTSEYGRASIDYINESVQLIKNNCADALVTAPVNKHSINKTFHNFTGHTEYLANLTTTKKVWMMLIGGPLRVVLATTHCALKDVPYLISKQCIKDTIIATNKALEELFCVSNPRIGVCGLNPHSSDKGVFGNEEQKIIGPAIAELKRKIKNLSGPLPADSLFYRAYHTGFDAVVAMYHDQGLVPLKMIGFETGVNITLGLPIVRTSPDHGTAMDIAGKNLANPSSLICAMRVVADVIKNRKNTTKHLSD